MKNNVRLVIMAFIIGFVAFGRSPAADTPAAQGKTSSTPKEPATAMSWGDTVDGIRVGISCALSSTTSDKQPVFTIKIENTSDHPITIPSPDSYVPKMHVEVKEFFVRPLHPNIKKLKSRNEGDPSYFCTGGEKQDEVRKNVTSLQPGGFVTLNDIPLQEDSYDERRSDYDGKTSLTQWVLLPESSYEIRFCFENENKKLNHVKMWTGMAESGPVRLDVKLPSVENFHVEGGFALSKTDYFLFEPIYARFSVFNRGMQTIRFPIGGDAGGHRQNRFLVTAMDDQGKKVEDVISDPFMGGGLGSSGEAEPGKSYEQTILVNAWCAFKHPGRYTITCRRVLNLMTDKSDFFSIEEMMPSIPIESKIAITMREDKRALETYIKTLSGSVDCNEIRNEWEILSRMKCDAAFPFIEKMAAHSGKYQSSAVEWLGFYGVEKASRAMREAVQSHDPMVRMEALGMLGKWKDSILPDSIRNALASANVEERREAVRICYDSKPEGCLPILKKMADDKDPLIRRYLSAALAAYGDKSVIPILLDLLRDPDPDPFIRIWAAGALQKLGRKDGIPVMIALLKSPATAGCRGSVTQVLEDLTGKKMREDFGEWNEWWEHSGKHDAKL